MNVNELLLKLDFMYNSEKEKRLLTLDEIKYLKQLLKER